MKITQGKIAELLDEPGCEHNHHKHGDKKNKACTQQAQPGAAQGGCAYDGAAIALVPITDAAHLVHGPIACAGNSWNSRGSLSSGPMVYKLGLTTDLSENDIIFGGEKRLYQSIVEVQQRYNPAAIFVYATCVTALIGDDLDAVCQKASTKLGTPVIPVNSPGFVGSKNLGNRIAGETLLEFVVGTAEPEYTTPYDINLIGEYNIAGELWNVLPLLEKLGIRVLAKITGDARYRDIACAHRAKLNVMICSKALINMARQMEERYGIPYLEESFYGVEDLNRCLRNIALKLGDRDLQQRVEDLIASETAQLDRTLAPYRSRLHGKRVVLYTGGVKSWSIISAAKDLGMQVTATSTRKSTEADKAKIKELLGQDGIMLAKGGAPELLRIIEQTQADMLIAGGRNQYTALKARIPFLDINQERHHAYAGYSGLVNLAQELVESLESPIWQQVRHPAPWEVSTYQLPITHYPSALPPRRPVTEIVTSKKAVTINPLKQSQPLGAAIAFLGLQGMMPLLHGSQGCTAFAKVVLVRHFRESIPLSTTALNEVNTILGGEDNVKQALLTVVEKFKPEIIGLCTTGLTETRGEDMAAILREFREEQPQLNNIPIVLTSTPDYKGGLQDGFAAVVESIVTTLPTRSSIPSDSPEGSQARVTVLAGSALGPGDVREIKDAIAAFGLTPIVVPDLSASLDGHLEDDYHAVTAKGTTIAELREIGRSACTLAIGESMRNAATKLEQQFGTPYHVFPQLTSLMSCDRFFQTLADLSGNPIPEVYRRQRRQLLDAMLDTHFYFGQKRVALALEPDLLYAIAWWFEQMGAEVQAAVTTTKSPLLSDLPLESATIGDLDDFEQLAAGCDLIVTNSNGAAIARRLHVPLYRLGYPIFDRLGNGQRCTVGYRGTMQLLFEIGNLFLDRETDISHQSSVISHQSSVINNQLPITNNQQPITNNQQPTTNNQ
jgi:nitrogenase molybdenum-cofactor synthesis protein NifE